MIPVDSPPIPGDRRRTPPPISFANERRAALGYESDADFGDPVIAAGSVADRLAGPDAPVALSRAERENLAMRLWRGVADRRTFRRAVDHAEGGDNPASLRASDEQLRSLVNNIAPLAWIADGGGSIYWFNRQWFDFTGGTLTEAKGTGWLAWLHPDYADPIRSRWERCLRNGQPWEDTFPLRGRDGRYRWFLSRVLPVHEGGAVVRWVGTHSDVTAQRNTEQKLLEQAQELQQFAFVASHDLREPLRRLSVYADLLRETPEAVTEKGRRFVEAMEESIRRMRTLIDDLVRFADLSKKDEKVSVDLAEIFRAVRSELETVIKAKDASVEAGPLPVVRADPRRMHQLFSNLVRNALTFQRREPIEIRVSAERAGSFWRVAVADNGIGIDPRFQDRIFGVFQRLHRRDEYPGSGIGLPIAKKIVESHEGRIWVVSEPDRGSTFYFTLPSADERRARVSTA